MNIHDPILLVEDDKIDQKSVLRAFHDLKIVNPLVVVQNGQEALDYLQDAKNKQPCLVLMDLRMPIMSGLECIEILKKMEYLKRIPVVVLTTSKDDQDLKQSFNFGVAGYMVKPVDYQKFVEMIRTIQVYWILSLTPPSTSPIEIKA